MGLFGLLDVEFFFFFGHGDGIQYDRVLEMGCFDIEVYVAVVEVAEKVEIRRANIIQNDAGRAPHAHVTAARISGVETPDPIGAPGGQAHCASQTLG